MNAIHNNIGHILILLRICITSDIAVIILDDGNYTVYVSGYSLLHYRVDPITPLCITSDIAVCWKVRRRD
jgi:hypothetical protein